MNANGAMGIAGSEQSRELSVGLLNKALATELICMFRYQRHYQLARDVYSVRVTERLLQQAEEECLHAERITQRIIDLGGVPDLRMETVPGRSFVEFSDPGEPDDVFLPALLEEDMAAEEIAADAYREIIDTLADTDPETCRLLEGLVAAEEAHAIGLGVLSRVLTEAGRNPGLAMSGES